MDFVARAGYVLDRAHRLAGVLLFVLALLAVMLAYAWMTIAKLEGELRDANRNLSIYVVPGAERAGIVGATKEDMLLEYFTDFALQSLNSYTAASLPAQYQEMQKFMSPQMLVNADRYFGKLIQESQTEGRARLLVMDRTNLQVRRLRDEETSGRPKFEVRATGERKEIVGGKVVASIPLQITLTLEQTNLSEANPFGYMMANYREENLNANAR